MMRKVIEMKKILIAVMMMFVGVTTAHAVDFEPNKKVLERVIVAETVKIVLGGKRDIDFGGVSVGTAGVIGEGKVRDCWTVPQYHGDGSVTMRMVCN